jgi:hypothetical protein
VAFLGRAYLKYKKGDHAGAIADLTRVVELDPRIAMSYLNRGVAKRLSGDHAGAVADFQRAGAGERGPFLPHGPRRSPELAPASLPR